MTTNDLNSVDQHRNAQTAERRAQAARIDAARIERDLATTPQALAAKRATAAPTLPDDPFEADVSRHESALDEAEREGQRATGGLAHADPRERARAEHDFIASKNRAAVASALLVEAKRRLADEQTRRATPEYLASIERLAAAEQGIVADFDPEIAELRKLRGKLDAIQARLNDKVRAQHKACNDARALRSELSLPEKPFRPAPVPQALFILAQQV
jgi:hypothetical protein